jgi:hypothetical protein
MKKLIVATVLMSFNLFAIETRPVQVCLTSGDCQTTAEAQQGYRCFIVNVATSSDGQKLCAQKCYTVQLGTVCEQLERKVYGLCQQEESSISESFDPSRPECSNYSYVIEKLPF